MMMVECALNLITGYRHWLQTSLYTHFQFHTRLISQRWNEMWTLSTADGPHFKYGKPIEPEASDRMKVLARITKHTMYENFRKWEMIDMTLEEGTITVCVWLCKKTSFLPFDVSTLCVLDDGTETLGEKLYSKAKYKVISVLSWLKKNTKIRAGCN